MMRLWLIGLHGAFQGAWRLVGPALARSTDTRLRRTRVNP